MPYRFSESKWAQVYEVFLPKKMSYASKLAEVLDSFLTDEGVRSIPAVREQMRRLRSAEARDRLIERIRRTINGYSIYEVDGRIATSGPPIDERTWVIRFVFHDPTGAGVGAERSDADRSLTDQLIEDLVARRFAEELGTEQEIWVLKYEDCSLRRWVKVDADDGGPD